MCQKGTPGILNNPLSKRLSRNKVKLLIRSLTPLKTKLTYILKISSKLKMIQRLTKLTDNSSKTTRDDKWAINPNYSCVPFNLIVYSVLTLKCRSTPHTFLWIISWTHTWNSSKNNYTLLKDSAPCKTKNTSFPNSTCLTSSRLSIHCWLDLKTFHSKTSPPNLSFKCLSWARMKCTTVVLWMAEGQMHLKKWPQWLRDYSRTTSSMPHFNTRKY